MKEELLLLPIEIQEQFLELAIEYNNEISKKIIDIYSDFIFTVNGKTASSMLLSSKKIYRCFENGVWVNCQAEEEYAKQKKVGKEKLEKNPYKVYGIFDKLTNKFYIRDILLEEKKRGKLSEGDARAVRTGKDCNNFAVNDLLSIFIRIGWNDATDAIVVNGKERFYADFTVDDLLTKLESSKYFTDEVKAYCKKDKRRLYNVYYIITRKKGDLCILLKTFFAREGLLDYGSAGGKFKKNL